MGKATSLERWIGVDQGCTKMLLTAEYNGDWIDEKVPTGLDVTQAYLHEQIDAFIARLPFKPEGIGMGVVGLVENDELVLSDTKGLQGMKASDFARPGCPCHIINDVKAATVEEASYHGDEDCMVMIMAGSGFAMGVKEQGRILMGRHGWAGELGSLIYPLDGELQSLDSISGGLGILKRAGMSAQEIHERLAAQDPEITALIRQAGTYFGIALVDIVHTFNPSHIVIGGSTPSYPGYMEAAREVLLQHALPTMLADCELKEPHDLKRIVALGARRYAYEKSKIV